MTSRGPVHHALQRLDDDPWALRTPPGKVTLTQRLPSPRRASGDGAPAAVQADTGRPRLSADDPFGLHLAPPARGPAAPAVQRTPNAVGIHASWRTDAAERQALAERLTDALGHPVAPTAAAIETALHEFQGRNADEIERVEEHGRDMMEGYDGPAGAFPEPRPDDPAERRAWAARRAAWRRTRGATGADGGARSTAGDLDPNDATHIVLANAWPRRFFGVLLQTADDGFDYLASQVMARGLPFDRDRVNIVGVRGVQGGTLHDDVGVGLAASTYDDSFFVLALDERGGKMIREFRGTTEPGGRSTEHRTSHPDEYAPDERSARVRDHDVETMEADQQVVYHLNTVDTSKLGRPTLTPRVTTDDGDGLVVAPHADGEPTSRESDPSLHADDDTLADGVADDDPRRRDRLRTRRGDEVLDRSLGIAIHSGGGADEVNADSTGCQVVHGDWYGDFTATLQAALTAERVRHGATGRAARTATQGDVLYSLLDGHTLARDEAGMRAGIARARAATGEPVPPNAGQVQRDGGGDGGQDAGEVHAHAQRGVAGSGGTLPHLDAIQAAFGHHEVGGVRAHVGGAATEAADAIGARAYATGNDVAFAAAPDLRQAAHEAAHVVQQRAGVALDGGVGSVGDPYEQHADAVADLVVRGESAAALLDTMAGGGGGAVQRVAVQREAESRSALQAAIAACDESTDLDPTIAALEALHPTRAERATEYPVTIDGAQHIIAGRDVATILRAARRRRGRLGTGVWDERSTPVPGMTFRGHRIADGRNVFIDGMRFHLSRGESGYGLSYFGDNAPFLAAGERLGARLEREGQPFAAAAARGAPVLHEGGVGAINTYDGMVFTLGPGYAGGRLASALRHIAGTPAGDTLSAEPYLAGLRFNGDHGVRLDIDACARIARICERDFPVELAEAWILDMIDNDALVGGRAAIAAGDAVAGDVIPEVVGVAEYLHHGYGDYAGAPGTRVAAAHAAHPGNPSAQVAFLLRAYAERAAQDREGRPDTYRSRMPRVCSDRLPNKIPYFIQAATARDATFRWDLAAAKAVARCITTAPPFEHTLTPPGGLYLDADVEIDDDGTTEHRYYSFDP